MYRYSQAGGKVEGIQAWEAGPKRKLKHLLSLFFPIR